MNELNAQLGDFYDLAAIHAKYVELCVKYPKRSPHEVAHSAFKLCGYEPGFHAAACANFWSTDLDTLEQIERLRPTSKVPDGLVPDKETLLAELLSLARNPLVDAKDRVAAYTKVLEAEGHIVKQTVKDTKQRPPVPSAIMFRVEDFDRDPEREEGDDDAEATAAVA